MAAPYDSAQQDAEMKGAGRGFAGGKSQAKGEFSVRDNPYRDIREGKGKKGSGYRSPDEEAETRGQSAMRNAAGGKGWLKGRGEWRPALQGLPLENTEGWAYALEGGHWVRQRELRCYNCGRVGHKRDRCFQPRWEQSTATGSHYSGASTPTTAVSWGAGGNPPAPPPVPESQMDAAAEVVSVGDDMCDDGPSGATSTLRPSPEAPSTPAGAKEEKSAVIDVDDASEDEVAEKMALEEAKMALAEAESSAPVKSHKKTRLDEKGLRFHHTLLERHAKGELQFRPSLDRAERICRKTLAASVGTDYDEEIPEVLANLRRCERTIQGQFLETGVFNARAYLHMNTTTYFNEDGEEMVHVAMSFGADCSFNMKMSEFAGDNAKVLRNMQTKAMETVGLTTSKLAPLMRKMIDGVAGLELQCDFCKTTRKDYLEAVCDLVESKKVSDQEKQIADELQAAREEKAAEEEEPEDLGNVETAEQSQGENEEKDTHMGGDEKPPEPVQQMEMEMKAKLGEQYVPLSRSGSSSTVGGDVEKTASASSATKGAKPLLDVLAPKDAAEGKWRGKLQFQATTKGMTVGFVGCMDYAYVEGGGLEPFVEKGFMKTGVVGFVWLAPVTIDCPFYDDFDKNGEPCVKWYEGPKSKKI